MDLEVEYDNYGVPVVKHIGKYREAVGNVESRGSGDYKAIGPRTKKGDYAYGRYQVMGNNLPKWTREALGRSLTPEQFLANPQAQDAVFNKYFGDSVQKYGNPQDAASVWFTGKPLAQGGNRQDITGTSGNEYVDRFNREMGFGGPGAANSQIAQLPTQIGQPSQLGDDEFGRVSPPQEQELQTSPAPAMQDLTGGAQEEVAAIAAQSGALPRGWSAAKLREAAKKRGVSPAELLQYMEAQSQHAIVP